jgi:hypothetical protein
MAPLYSTPYRQLPILAVGEESYPRSLIASAAVSSATGRLRITYWRAHKSETITSMRVYSGGTAAGAAPTLVQWGIYTVDPATWTATLAAQIANDVTLYAAANTPYTRALTAPWAKVAGQWYASTSLVITAAAAPTLTGIAGPGSIGPEWGVAEPMAAFLDGQVALPAGFTLAAVTASANAVWFAHYP